VKINLKVCRDIEMNTFNQKLASLEIARAALRDGNDFEATVTEMGVINGEVQVQILERPNELSSRTASQNASGAP
jgi:hypothetical protein